MSDRQRESVLFVGIALGIAALRIMGTWLECQFGNQMPMGSCTYAMLESFQGAPNCV